MTITGFMAGYMLASEEKWMGRIIRNTQASAFEVVSNPVYNQTIRTTNNHTLLLKLLLTRRQETEATSLSTEIATSGAMRSGQITTRFNGGTGNQMFEYSAMVGTAMRNNLVPFISKGGLLPKMFILGDPTIYAEGTDFTKLTVIGESQSCAYSNNVEHLDLKGARAEMTGYRQSWKYFSKYNEVIRRHFTFNTEISKEASGVLDALRGSKQNVTLVAVHIRRGDILVEPFKSYGYLVPDEDYFNRSMNYFRDKYKNVSFVVCSNGIDWAKSALHAVNDDIRFVEGKRQEVDLAIMSRCDHVIMSVGSFGWWASWLAGGEVIYYKTPARAGSSLASQFNYPEYYPANWIAMCNNEI
ncbi:galactoside alpha-(1,2)-fucosyltransferase 1-like [Lineus longissimus]|uniref:galactoside alpha-(1,2)-fucosyltransferase 1-like n=1 Tax=Lineus longissimus TaxID=88925 RepID=UPI00315C7E3A